MKPGPASDNGSIDIPAALETHRRWLRTVVLARVYDCHAVDEVMQEVALAAVRGRSLPPNSGDASAWLYQVAVRQSLLYRRKQGREAERITRFRDRRQCDDQPSDAGDPLRWLLADEEVELVRNAMDQISEEDREVLLLKYTEDWSCRELAERLCVSVTAVETRLYRARQRLRAALARADVIEEER